MMEKNRSDSARQPSAADPLTPAVFHILLALADGDSHGYGIMMEVRQRTGGRIRMGPGTLYGTLKRMLADGLVTEAEQPTGEPGEERRRYYSITAKGRQAAVAEAERLENLVDIARGKNLLPGQSSF